MKLASLILTGLMASAVFMFTSKYAYQNVKIVLDKANLYKNFHLTKLICIDTNFMPFLAFTFRKKAKNKHLRKGNDSEIKPVPWISKKSKIF